jgi:hypothetical protein
MTNHPRPSPALYRRFTANVADEGLTVEGVCRDELGYNRTHVYRVLTGERKGGPEFWDAIRPWLV